MVDLLYKRGHPSAPILTRRKRWVCESFSELDREFAQSPVCRITELEQEVKRLRGVVATIAGFQPQREWFDVPDDIGGIERMRLTCGGCLRMIGIARDAAAPAESETRGVT